MSEIVNIVKLEQLKEYLNQRGVSQKLLLNPRFYEILDLIMYVIPFISIDDSAKKKLDSMIQVIGQEEKTKERKNIKSNKSGKIKIVINPYSYIIKCYTSSDEMVFQQEVLKQNDLIIAERKFDKNGIEIFQKKGVIQIEPELFGNNQLTYILFERKERLRDKERPDIVIEEFKSGETVWKREFYRRKKFVEFENLLISKRNKERFYIADEQAYYKTGSSNEYNIIKEYDIPDYERIIKEYEWYNRNYGFTQRYEEGIKKMCLKSKLLGGD